MKIKKLIKELKKRGKIKLIQESKDIAKSYFEKSKNSFKAAKILLNQKLIEESISMSYYAMYNKLLSLLYKIGIKSENHFFSIYILKEVFDLDNKDILFAKKERINKQYYPNSNLVKKDAKELIKLSESFIEKLDLTEMFDLTVKDTHTVIMENGIITHQCEGGAHLLMKLLELNNVPAWRRKLCAGHVIVNGELVGHAYVIFLGDDFEWYVLDVSYYPSLSKRYWLKTPHRKISKYGSVWFTFNEELIWCKHDYVLNGVEDDYNV